MNIGSMGIPHTTVANDVALHAQLKSDMQVMVLDAENGAWRDMLFTPQKVIHLNINPAKKGTPE